MAGVHVPQGGIDCFFFSKNIQALFHCSILCFQHKFPLALLAGAAMDELVHDEELLCCIWELSLTKEICDPGVVQGSIFIRALFQAVECFSGFTEECRVSQA